ncbi:ABC transporter substrate-binding protein [uncultured Clostridium sp.]|uniref:substrate-binding periplasmic protein n=1 Tax=uncultured Clostridium sp. TaxID=59620 RepID=UPI0025E63282|nr:ABC transporter substrate-binding protein [uncultured Clostridium sp.]
MIKTRKHKRNILSFLSAMLIMTTVSMMGCGNSTATTSSQSDTDTTATEYDNSYCVDGKPSEELQKLRENGTLVVGSSGDAPFAYIDEKTGEFTGVDAEIIKEVAKRLGIKKVEMKLIPFSELIVNLNSDNIDIICDCLCIREERAKLIYYGDLWYVQGGTLLVPEESPINGAEDFDPNSTVVGYTAGTTFQKDCEKWAESGSIKEAKAVGDQSEAIVAIQNHKIDAFLTDESVVESIMKNEPDTLKGLKMAPNYKTDESEIGKIAPSVSFKNIPFMKEINNVMKDLRDEGFVEKVLKDNGLDPARHLVTNDNCKHDMNTKEE